MRKSLSCLAVLVLLAGCGQTGSARQILGLNREAPDAFSVTTHAPLAVPSNLSAPLPLPMPGAARPQETSAVTAAQQAVFNAPQTAAEAPSAAEQALLDRAGSADPHVRAMVNREATEDAADQQGTLDWMFFWRADNKPGIAVDAVAEADRLKQNRAAGKPATEGATPVIEDSGLLGAPEAVQ